MDDRDFAELRRFADQWACQKIHEKYWYAEAKRDVDMICSVFTEDARYGKNSGQAEIRKQVEIYMGHMGPIIENYHVLPISADIQIDGDRAKGEIRGVAFNPFRGKDGALKVLVVGVGYLNEFVRTPDGWRISSMGGIEGGLDVPHDTTWKYVADQAEGGLMAVLNS
jgi:hypothetical protein